MKWLKRKLYSWINEISNENCEIAQNRLVCQSDLPGCDTDPVLNFRVFGAVGGRIVEFSRYDRKTDRRDTTTYIIKEDEDFGDSIKKISTLEMLK